MRVHSSATLVTVVRTAAIAAAFLMVSAYALAAKTDVVVLRNGDRFTGEVKQLRRGQLKLSTDDAGTLYIEWDKIVAVTTAGRYEVVTADGSHYVGTLAPDTVDRLQVIAEDGTASHLGRLDVVSFASIKSGFFGRIDGSFDLGANYTQSSGVGQLSLDLDATYRRPLFEAFTDISSNLTRQRNEPSTSRFTLKSGYTRFRPNQWFISPFVYVERNPDLGLTLRTLGALTVGRYLVQSNHESMLLAAGGAVGRERPIEGAPIPNLDAVIAFATSFYSYDFPRSNADLSVLVFPELNHIGRVRANLDTKLKRELFRDFFAAVTAYDSFDSQPQVPNVDRNDLGITLSVGWTF